MIAKLTSNSRVEEIVSQRNQIRILDPSRKWLSAIRNSCQTTNVNVDVVLDWTKLCESTEESGPAVAIAYIDMKGIISAVSSIGRLNSFSQLPVVALMDAPDDDLGALLRQVGFSAVICGLTNVDRVRKLALRYFDGLPDSETPLELFVERNLPWNPAS